MALIHLLAIQLGCCIIKGTWFITDAGTLLSSIMLPTDSKSLFKNILAVVLSLSKVVSPAARSGQRLTTTFTFLFSLYCVKTLIMPYASVKAVGSGVVTRIISCENEIKDNEFLDIPAPVSIRIKSISPKVMNCWAIASC